MSAPRQFCLTLNLRDDAALIREWKETEGRGPDMHERIAAFTAKGK